MKRPIKETYSTPKLFKHDSLRDLTAQGSYAPKKQGETTYKLWYRWT
jgi:hypothetical protein